MSLLAALSFHVGLFLCLRIAIANNGRLMAILMKTTFFLLCVGVSLAADPPTVNVPGMATFTGTTTLSRGGRAIKQFFAIPYAEPPTDDKRFVAPVKKNWPEEDGAFDASIPGPICTQFVVDSQGSMLPTAQDLNMDFLDGAVQNESCLTLDIHVPEVSDAQKKLPILFFIHGGSFVGGTSQIMTPHFFLDHDMIIVAPQYRLGPLGFLKLTGNDEIVGNAALLDQLEALKWVQENIEAFGGDPDKVTLAGNSAGAVCAGLLHISPLTNNTLFQQVIQISGSVSAPFAIDLKAGEKGNFFAMLALCTGPDDVVACLQNATIESINKANEVSVMADLAVAGNGMPNSLPTIQESGTDIVIDNTAEVMLGRKTDSLLPTITGVTRNEGMFPIQVLEKYLDYLNTNYSSDCIACTEIGIVLPLILGTYNSFLIEAMQESYFPDEPYETYLDMYPSFVDFMGSMYFKAPAYDTAVSLSSLTDVYLYTFDHQDTFNYYGVGHAGDMVYLFPNGTNLTSEETEVSKKVVSLYANFVINGKPTADDVPEWKPFQILDPSFMEMNTQFELRSDFEETYTISRRKGLQKSTGAGSHVLPSLLIVCLFNFLARFLE